MQTRTTTLIIALLGVLPLLNPVLGATTPQAQTDSTQTAPQKGTMQVGLYRSIHSLTMNVMVEKPVGGKGSVMLLNKKGKVLYRHMLSLRQSKYWLKLDFTGIPDDTYSVIVTNGAEKITKSIYLSTQTLYEMPARTLLVMN